MFVRAKPIFVIFNYFCKQPVVPKRRQLLLRVKKNAAARTNRSQCNQSNIRLHASIQTYISLISFQSDMHHTAALQKSVTLSKIPKIIFLVHNFI